MSIFDRFFRRTPSSAQKAKERLQIIVAHQRDGRESNKRNEPAFMADMKREILEVVKKYVDIGEQDVEANISKEGDTDVLALNINLQDHEKVEQQES
ncbi:cell division topological specificity factor MinE [Suttonella sp. R2A3]|uniref:cell division topological specificity factor MinE n=1 Tax=Suttonella sp. R2A3 TaxID=2908648 RepID=UPI001F257734|nr:cell division topological specificity factor MinE [Suttonella sp. R2A3]UJF25190.1 cell division topological specificity factor MinE [Suttonella sp. R2A3]